MEKTLALHLHNINNPLQRIRFRCGAETVHVQGSTSAVLSEEMSEMMVRCRMQARAVAHAMVLITKCSQAQQGRRTYARRSTSVI